MNSDNMQPAEENNSLEEDAYEPTYSEAFPPLPESESRDVQQNKLESQWNQKMAVKSSVITQMFRVPLEERRFKEMNEQRFGEQGEQAKICADIMQKTGAHIEISLARDQSLTILVTGKQEAVMRARRLVVTQLQTQANILISIPKEHHRFIWGKNGKKLQELEMNTTTKIKVPRPEDNSDLLEIIGTKDGIDKARHEIQLISDERAKLAFERLQIPKAFHPFICGARNENINQMMQQTNARINVPPPSVNKNELTVAGEKEGVAKAVEMIMKIYEEKKRKCQVVSVEVRKSQHKYVIGPKGNNLQEILANTGVSVEMPSLESPSETITLRGEQDKLGPALTLVYAKANSVIIAEVDVPSWLHKFIIGKKGANIRQITQDLPKVHVEFTDGQDKITVEGPPEEVEQARKALEERTKELLNLVSFEEIEVDPKYHRHIIGKNGTNVNRIKAETGVLIRIPSDNESSKVIRIEGNPKGVSTAKKELLNMVNKMENERSKDIIIEQRFHRTIIGTKGENIKDIRDKFNQVNIAFPEPGKKSDAVTIRGPKNDVEKCYKYLSQLNQEMIISNYRVDVPIFKQIHKNIIGKGGGNIRKIRDETDTKIDLPSEESDSDVIIITGKQVNVEAARERILAIQNELANIVSVDIIIPAKFHNSLIGAKGHLIRSIMEDCGGVHIRFPPEGSGSDKVNIRGPKDDVDNAKKQLQELTTEKQISSCSVEIRARPEHHKFLIGRNGVNIKKVRDKTGARIIFPTDKDEDKEVITIIGKKDAVDQAKSELELLIKDLDKVVEAEIKVDPKYYRHFVARRWQVLREINEEYGGVAVSLPRTGSNSDRVVLKGAKECVEGAKKRIAEIVAELEAQVTIECIIPQKNHRTMMGAKGSKLQAITQQYDVQIKFPDRELRDDVEDQSMEIEEPTVNGEIASQESSENGEGDKPNKTDVIRITGRKENCEAAKLALLARVPITEEINVPYDFHRFIIGQKGKDVRSMMEEFDVSITIPPALSHSDIINVSGPPANVKKAKEALIEKVRQLENDKEQRLLRNFKLQVRVEPRYHPKIIGRKGAVITKIRQDHDVQIQFPERGEENEDVITITGLEKHAEAAKKDILKIVQNLEDMINEEVCIDHRVHPRLIGSKGRNIRKIMEDFNVDIKFPRPEDSDPDLIIITGKEDDALEAKDHLLNLEEEYKQDMSDIEVMKQYTMPPSRHPDDLRSPTNSRGFVVRDAPWDQPPGNGERGGGGGGGGGSSGGNNGGGGGSSKQAAPDTSNTTEFPTFGTAAPVKPNMAWRPKP